jgi:hypothetical protein
LGYFAVRPQMLRWGATDKEAREPLPGGDVCLKPRVQSTRAITIDAPPEEVWPWIVISHQPSHTLNAHARPITPWSHPCQAARRGAEDRGVAAKTLDLLAQVQQPLPDPDPCPAAAAGGYSDPAR